MEEKYYEGKAKEEAKKAFDIYCNSAKNDKDYQTAYLNIMSNIAVSLGVIADKLNK